MKLCAFKLTFKSFNIIFTTIRARLNHDFLIPDWVMDLLIDYYEP